MGNPSSGIPGRASQKILNRTNVCGGHKKAGIPSLVGRPVYISDYIKTRCSPNPSNPFPISSTNVLSGGVGRYQNMFKNPADGVNRAKLQKDRQMCLLANGGKPTNMKVYP
jgi:hypothetical protein